MRSKSKRTLKRCSINHFIPLIALIALLTYSNGAYGQFSGKILTEVQAGKLPSDTATFVSAYNRSILNYQFGKFRAGITLEEYLTPFTNRNYFRFNQIRLQYRSKHLDVKIGNFNYTPGRGIFLRTYEVPGAILEDLSYRSRHYFQRDFSGVLVRLNKGGLSLELAGGKPLDNVIPPVYEDTWLSVNPINNNRRIDQIVSGKLTYDISGQTIGTQWMLLNQQDVFGSFNMNGVVGSGLSYYAEGAQLIGPDKASALYVNLNYDWMKFGISSEFKFYENFNLGTGFNEPPALIKQHTYRVLNRSTHVSDPFDEKGFQLEAYYFTEDLTTITLNVAHALNDFGVTFKFTEFFLELDRPINDHSLKLFMDYANDQLKSEEHRISFGSHVDWKIPKKRVLTTELELQQFQRFGESTFNALTAVGLKVNQKLNFAITYEISTDPFLINNSSATRSWIGASGRFKVNSNNELMFFAGTRRGGPACTSGICYEVLDFEGLEIRYSLRL
ncbi:MAG: hypothetical protein JXQ90_00915 [Cyclobacteriaceae bacterium]